MEEIKNLIRQNPDKFKKNPLLSIVASMCGEEKKYKIPKKIGTWSLRKRLN